MSHIRKIMRRADSRSPLIEETLLQSLARKMPSLISLRERPPRLLRQETAPNLIHVQPLLLSFNKKKSLWEGNQYMKVELSWRETPLSTVSRVAIEIASHELPKSKKRKKKCLLSLIKKEHNLCSRTTLNPLISSCVLLSCSKESGENSFKSIPLVICPPPCREPRS